MIRETTLDAWEAIIVTLPRRRSEVLRYVLASPGSTALELEKSSGNRYVNMRLSELERLGCIFSGEARACSVSGRQSVTWWPATTPVMKKPERIKSARPSAAVVRAAIVDIEAAGLLLTTEARQVLAWLRATTEPS